MCNKCFSVPVWACNSTWKWRHRPPHDPVRLPRGARWWWSRRGVGLSQWLDASAGKLLHVYVHLGCWGQCKLYLVIMMWKYVGMTRIQLYWHLFCVSFQAFYFPEHAGVPMFSPEDLTPLYLRLEMHYDNPSHIEGSSAIIINHQLQMNSLSMILIQICTVGKMDNSGIRLHMTPTLREHDIGAILIGSDVGPFMLIPPHFNTLTYRGHCMSQCLQYVSKA